MTSIGRIAVALAAFIATGCIGIAHQQFSVPVLEVNARSAAGERVVDVLCVDSYGSAQSLLDVATGSLVPRTYAYDWKRLKLGTEATRSECREESRYIGAPVFLFFFLGSSREGGMSRQLLIHPAGSPLLYRVQAHGNTTHVEATSISEAAARIPPRLKEPPPTLRLLDKSAMDEWSGWSGALSTYYRSVRWEPSDGIVVTGLNTDGQGGILSLTLEVRQSR